MAAFRRNRWPLCLGFRTLAAKQTYAHPNARAGWTRRPRAAAWPPRL